MDAISAAWRVLVLGIVAGSLYAPVASGLVIVYRSSGVLNFAQGALAFVGGYAFFLASSDIGLPVWAAIPAALVLVAVLGLVIHLVVIAPVAGRGPVIVVMATIALSSLLEAGIYLIFGTGQRFVDDPFSNKGIRLPGGVAVAPLDIAIVVATVVILLALILVMRFTRFGIAVRAVSDSPLLAGLWGQNSSRVVGWTWAISCALSAVAGIADAMHSVLDSGMLTLGTLVFPAVILGGMDSLGGAMLGSLLLGIAVEATTIYLSVQWSDFVVYAALLVLLFVRPRGLFGRREVARL